MKSFAIIIDWVMALGTILIGLNLATSRTVGPESYLQVIGQGIGWYLALFVGWFIFTAGWEMPAGGRGGRLLEQFARAVDPAVAFTPEDRVNVVGSAVLVWLGGLWFASLAARLLLLGADWYARTEI